MELRINFILFQDKLSFYKIDSRAKSLLHVLHSNRSNVLFYNPYSVRDIIGKRSNHFVACFDQSLAVIVPYRLKITVNHYSIDTVIYKLP
jgi:hypothetical protein